MGARYADGSGAAVQRDAQGRITGGATYDAQGRVTSQLQASDTFRLNMKDDGTLEQSRYRATELPGHGIYDRTGRQIGRTGSTMFDHLTTESTRPDGTRKIEDHKNGTITEIGKDRIKQTYKDGSSREVQTDAAGVANRTTYTARDGRTETWVREPNSDTWYQPGDTEKKNPWTGTVNARPDGSITEVNSRTGMERRISPTGEIRHFDREGAEHIKDKYGETQIRIKDGKYLVTGPDGKEREYVEAARHEQTPGRPTHGTNGGKIENKSDRPILALGKAPGYEGNPHGDGFLRIVPPGRSTTPQETDYDGVVTDSRFQPVTLPDGRVLMPAKVDADAKWTKISDTYTGTVTRENGEIRVGSPDWTSLLGVRPNHDISEYTGGVSVRPQRWGQRRAERDE